MRVAAAACLASVAALGADVVPSGRPPPRSRGEVPDDRARPAAGMRPGGASCSGPALTAYREALPSSRAGAEREAMLNTLGHCLRELGMPGEAAEFHRQAEAEARLLGDYPEHAAALDGLGLALTDRCEFEAALQSFTAALREYTALHAPERQAEVLCHVAEVRVDLGAWRDAADACGEALDLALQTGRPDIALIAKRNISAAYLGWKRWPQAQAQLSDLLRQAIAAGNLRDEVSARNGLSFVRLMQGDVAMAAGMANEALRLARAAGNEEGKANALGNLAAAQARSGAIEPALAGLEEALAIYQQRGEPTKQASILYGLAEALEIAGRLDEARLKIEQALALVEQYRTRAVADTLRADFFAARQDSYELDMRVLMRLDRERPGEGYDVRAFEVSETTRTRTLLDNIAVNAAGDLASAGDADLRALRARAKALERWLAVAQDRAASAAGASPDEAAASRPAGLDLRKLDTKLEETWGELRSRVRRVHPGLDPQPLTLAQIRSQLLAPDTLLLAYSLGDQESYLWTIDRETLHAYRLPDRATIERAAIAVYQALALGSRPRRAAIEEAARRRAELSRLILAPAARDLRPARRLLIAADGALHYAPFAALPEPPAALDGAPWTGAEAPPLLLAHEVDYLPSASVVALLRRELAGRSPAPNLLAVLADPVFRADDVRVRRAPSGSLTPDRLAPAPAGDRVATVATDLAATPWHDTGASAAERSARDAGLEALPRLPFSGVEADAILRLVPAKLALRAVGFDATRDLAVSPRLAQYRILHFATHAFLDTVEPELSGLVLSLVDSKGRPRDGFLRAYDLYGLRLTADLVVLSACQTALGSEVRGEGLVGLTRGFMSAGVPRVVVSLWNVGDRATADLMARFYRGLLLEHLPAAAALRAAQLAAYRQTPSPASWAAFELQGDWH